MFCPRCASDKIDVVVGVIVTGTIAKDDSFLVCSQCEFVSEIDLPTGILLEYNPLTLADLITEPFEVPERPYYIDAPGLASLHGRRDS